VAIIFGKQKLAYALSVDTTKMMEFIKGETMPNKLCVELVPKQWGKEYIITNNALGCYKILYLEPNKLGSKHYHKSKNETFLIAEGAVRLEYEGVETEFLLQNESFVIAPHHWHRFVAIDKPAKIIEISDQHFDQDTFRINVARDMTPNEIAQMEKDFNEYLNRRKVNA
jgi:mannose-6-phosphate isomerase-like protein (cupin superfamily)